MNQDNEIMRIVAVCRSLGMHVRNVRSGFGFTAMLWEDTDGITEAAALQIQRRIKRKVTEYPGIVCYCFDAFSMLIYRV